MRKLYGRQTSINVQKASWALAELDLDVEWIFKDDKPGALETPEYAALNPQMRVPTLDDDGTIVRQSNVIVRYLAQKYGVGGLWPDDPGTRADADYWMDWQASDNWRNVVALFWNLYRVAPEDRNDAEIAKGAAAWGDDFLFLNKHLEGQDFVVGNQLTMGDIPIGAAVHRFYVMPIERPSLPAVEAYYARLQDRAAYRDRVMVPLS